MSEEIKNTKLDYPRLWKTLLKMGLKESFSVVRLQFFMTIAKEGNVIYKGRDKLEELMHSKVFELKPELTEYAKLAIGENDEFKNYKYATEDGDMMIEYFANMTSPMYKEYIDFASNCKETDYNIDGNCVSFCVDNVIDGDESSEPITQKITVHFIIISDNNRSIDPEVYPMVIKHELTHACLYNLRKNIKTGYFNNCRIPSIWTDEQISQWNDDIKYVEELLDSNSIESDNFTEFICEFLMYESDGQIKVKNPTVEARSPKNVKSDAKPKVTYRNVTPFERFQEVIDTIGGSYKDIYEPILESLRSCYDDYENFLEEIRM